MKKLALRRTAGLALLASLVAIWAAIPALGDHIPETGPLPASCVEFQAGNTGSKSVGDVTITLNSWTATPGDPHTVTFTITGLAPNQYVDISVKSGTAVEEDGPYGNGTHSFSNGIQNGISHIRLCVFAEDTTTTTQQDTTTTTEQDTTTTTEQDTTTTTEQDTTTTTVDETTTTTEQQTTTTTAQETTTTVTTPEVGPSTTVAEATTTTVEEEVLQETTSTTEAPTTTQEDETEDTLPFTGIGTDGMAMAAALALAAGAGLVLLSNRSNEGGRHSS